MVKKYIIKIEGNVNAHSRDDFARMAAGMLREHCEVLFRGGAANGVHYFPGGGELTWSIEEVAPRSD